MLTREQLEAIANCNEYTCQNCTCEDFCNTPDFIRNQMKRNIVEIPCYCGECSFWEQLEIDGTEGCCTGHCVASDVMRDNDYCPYGKPRGSEVSENA